jgi:anti-sigma factor RsiW
MTDHNDENNEIRPGEAELTLLADGSLPASERESLQAQVAGSPELQTRLRQQQRAVALVQATGEMAAPASLRASVAGLTDATRRRPGRYEGRQQSAADRRQTAFWRPRASLGIVAVAVVLIAVVSVALHGQTAPSVGSTARLALAPATGPAPTVSPTDRDVLSVRPTGASSIPFPSYVQFTAWRASGVRRDTLQGRHVTTVFYSVAGTRVGYSIVSGAPLIMPPGSTVRGPTGIRYVFASSDGAQILTWRRDGHTCVIAGRSVAHRTLLALAAADEQI